MSGPRGAAAIVGVGHACFGEAPGLSPVEILAQAAEVAVRDAGPAASSGLILKPS